MAINGSVRFSPISFQNLYNSSSGIRRLVEMVQHAVSHIDSCISRIKGNAEERMEQATNIANQTRQLVEHCSCLVYAKHTGDSFDYDGGDRIYDFFHAKARSYIKSLSAYWYLVQAHDLYQGANAHSSNTDDENLRIVLHQFESLIHIKHLLKNEFDMDVLKNLDRFPLDLDDTFVSYYKSILNALDAISADAPLDSDYYYIQSQRLIYLEGRCLYEITVYPVMSQRAPTNRIIVFSQERLLPYYAVQLKLAYSSFVLSGQRIQMRFVRDWEVSIRPCELDGFASLMRMAVTNNRKHLGYVELMGFLKSSYWTIPDIVRLPDDEFEVVMDQIFEGNRKKTVCAILLKLRDLYKRKVRGANVLLYLSTTMNDELIDNQKPKHGLHGENDDIGGELRMSTRTLTFDGRPLSACLIQHTPVLSCLARCFDMVGREGELLSRNLDQFSNETGRIYENVADFSHPDLMPSIIQKYNKIVEFAKKECGIGLDNDHVFLKANEQSTDNILMSLSRAFKIVDPGYSQKAKAYLIAADKDIDDPDKKDILSRMFVSSSIAFLCGKAGTGKSTLLGHVSCMFGGEEILAVAKTKPAVDRLKRVFQERGASVRCSTIDSVIRSASRSVELLIIDESSVVSNRDMMRLLNKVMFQKIILTGDPYQLQSIEFGNWFELGMKVFYDAVFELKKNHRGVTNQRLLTFWDEVRKGSDAVESALHQLHASKPLKSEDVFAKRDESDEVTLCLNYNGLYGINCINEYLQSANPNPPFEINHRIFKVGDPVLFIETSRFRKTLYNNLKGVILEIAKTENGLLFKLRVDANLGGLSDGSFDLLSAEGNQSIVSFEVFNSRGMDDKWKKNAFVVPFQLAYAVSIHKAQGLEYDSVRMVLANDVEERISYDVFYTAITRAKKKLSIYWTPETESAILKRLRKESREDDYKIFLRKNPRTKYR